MEIEIIENNEKKQLSFVDDEYDFFDSLDELKNKFKPFVFDKNIIKYFGIDLLWQIGKYQ